MNNKQFMFQDMYETVLYFKGEIQLDDIDTSIWEEFFELSTLVEVEKYFDLEVFSHYVRYGFGYDEDGDFRTDFIHNAKKGRGAFMITEIRYTQKQYVWDCEHSLYLYYDNEQAKTIPLPKEIKFNPHEHWLGCHLHLKECNIDRYYCRNCDQYIKTDIRK